MQVPDNLLAALAAHPEAKRLLASFHPLTDYHANAMFVWIPCKSADWSNFQEKYDSFLIAVEVGMEIVRRIAVTEGQEPAPSLDLISVTEYIERFRDRLPTKLSGHHILKEFGSIPRVKPDSNYKIRSRFEHAVYERARLLRLIAEKDFNNLELSLQEAGELLYAQHWSLGQRCGFGAAESDILISALRRKVSPEIYGAQVAGNGIKDGVFVLAKKGDPAIGVINKTVDETNRKIGRLTFGYAQPANSKIDLNQSVTPDLSIIVDSDVNRAEFSEFLHGLAKLYTLLSNGDELVIREGHIPVGVEVLV